jgi:hypothetical protein
MPNNEQTNKLCVLNVVVLFLLHQDYDLNCLIDQHASNYNKKIQILTKEEDTNGSI